MVGLDRLELSTSPLSGVRSSHLSYRPGYAPAPTTKAWHLASAHFRADAFVLEFEFEDKIERAFQLSRN